MAEIIDLPDAHGLCWRVVPCTRLATVYQLQCANPRPGREACVWIHVAICPTALDAIAEVPGRALKSFWVAADLHG